MIVNLIHCSLLHNSSLFHDKNSVAELVDDVEIVRNKEIAQIQLFPKVAKKLEDLGLDRYVQGRNGFVRDDKAGPSDESCRDADSLSLAAGEF